MSLLETTDGDSAAAALTSAKEGSKVLPVSQAETSESPRKRTRTDTESTDTTDKLDTPMTDASSTIARDPPVNKPTPAAASNSSNGSHSGSSGVGNNKNSSSENSGNSNASEEQIGCSTSGITTGTNNVGPPTATKEINIGKENTITKAAVPVAATAKHATGVLPSSAAATTTVFPGTGTGSYTGTASSSTTAVSNNLASVSAANHIATSQTNGAGPAVANASSNDTNSKNVKGEFTLRLTLTGHTRAVSAVKYSPDGISSTPLIMPHISSSCYCDYLCTFMCTRVVSVFPS